MKSASQAIKDQIADELGAMEGVSLFNPHDNGVRFTYINSALVSAQNRERFYVTNFGDIEQPKDRGILLRDILETGTAWEEKGYPLRACAGGASLEHDSQKSKRTYSAESVIFQRPRGFNKGYMKYEKSPTLTANGAWQDNNHVAEPFRIGHAEGGNPKYDSKPYRVYSPGGKSVTLCGEGGGAGAKTGLYVVRLGNLYGQNSRWGIYGSDGKAPTFLAATGMGGGHVPMFAAPTEQERCNQKNPTAKNQVYEVRNGLIAIKDKHHPIKLPDGFYVIRKLTITECCRLQTMPDDYCKAVSATQGYKGLGNGWTAEVIIHLLTHALKNVPRDTPIQVLSMYDGIGTGRYCLGKMGFRNIKYHAYEIDKFAIQVALDNYPDIIQHGDAFHVREHGWRL